jgi:hypothetical protein
VGAAGGNSPLTRLLAFTGAFDVVPQEQGEAGFVDRASGEFEDGLSGFGGGEVRAVHFEKHNSDDKARTHISIDEWMVLDDARDIGGGPVDYVYG